MKNVISTELAPAAIGPYSQAIEVNGMVYTSGIIPVDPATGVIPEGAAAQADRVFKSMSALLEAAGTSRIWRTSQQLMRCTQSTSQSHSQHVRASRLPESQKMFF